MADLDDPEDELSALLADVLTGLPYSPPSTGGAGAVPRVGSAVAAPSADPAPSASERGQDPAVTDQPSAPAGLASVDDDFVLGGAAKGPRRR